MVKLDSIASALDLIARLGAPERLVQHHRLVAEAATLVLDGLSPTWRRVVDGPRVQVGAAVHDVGKVLHPAEMRIPGTQHEPAGEALLVSAGVSPEIARMAVTHAAWSDTRAELEDHLVALADKLWKGKRERELEELVARGLSTRLAADFWEVYPQLDDLFERVAAGGEARLARS